MIMYWTHSLLFLFCLVASAFFAACETALMSVSLSAWTHLRRDRPRVEAAYSLWSHNPSLVIATLLFGNTLTSLGASVVASSLARTIAVDHAMSTAMLLTLTSLFAGSTILLIGDILPKLYARHAPGRILIGSAGVLTAVTFFLKPVLNSLALMSNAVRKLLSFIPAEPLITADELKQAVSATYVEGLPASSRQILSNLVAFHHVKVHEVMIPRNHMVAVRLEHNAERVFEHIVRTGFSRVPVYFGTMDNIVGIVYAKDLLVEWRSSGLLILDDLLRPPYRIAPDAPLSALLQGFRQGHHMAVVTDARGRTQGIVTVEDVVEAIVGDIADEFDQPR